VSHAGLRRRTYDAPRLLSVIQSIPRGCPSLPDTSQQRRSISKRFTEQTEGEPMVAHSGIQRGVALRFGFSSCSRLSSICVSLPPAFWFKQMSLGQRSLGGSKMELVRRGHFAYSVYLETTAVACTPGERAFGSGSSSLPGSRNTQSIT
jgi:hypothetical protein